MKRASNCFLCVILIVSVGINFFLTYQCYKLSVKLTLATEETRARREEINTLSDEWNMFGHAYDSVANSNMEKERRLAELQTQLSEKK